MIVIFLTVRKWEVGCVVVVHAFSSSPRKAGLWVWGQAGLQNEYQDTHDYTEKPHLQKQNKPTNKKPKIEMQD